MGYNIRFSELPPNYENTKAVRGPPHYVLTLFR